MEFGERYSRQVLFTPIGPAGQKKLAAARVVIAGCGATGSAMASLLARAGAGYLRIVDRDYVEPGNLQRQMLFDEADGAVAKFDRRPRAEFARSLRQQIGQRSARNRIAPMNAFGIKLFAGVGHEQSP